MFWRTSGNRLGYHEQFICQRYFRRDNAAIVMAVRRPGRVAESVLGESLDNVVIYDLINNRANRHIIRIVLLVIVPWPPMPNGLRSCVRKALLSRAGASCRCGQNMFRNELYGL